MLAAFLVCCHCLRLRDKKVEKHILMNDLCDDTFDAFPLAIGNGVFEVVTINGNTHLKVRTSISV
jgi:hypothetical protein